MKLHRSMTILVLVLVTVDQVSKWLAQAHLPFQQPVPVIPFFSLFLTHNRGVAFSMLTWIGSTGLIIMTVIIIGFLLWLWKRVPREQQLANFGFAFVLSGAVGNLIDRVFQGYVIDYFLVHTQSWAFAVFNVADSFITIGAVAIIAQEVLLSRQKKVQ